MEKTEKMRAGGLRGKIFICRCHRCPVRVRKDSRADKGHDGACRQDKRGRFSTDPGSFTQGDN